MNDVWEPSNRAQFFLIFGSFGQKRAFFSFAGSANSLQACDRVFETVVRILGSNCVNWEGAQLLWSIYPLSLFILTMLHQPLNYKYRTTNCTVKFKEQTCKNTAGEGSYCLIDEYIGIKWTYFQLRG
jgi:hypothetical protein